MKIKLELVISHHRDEKWDKITDPKNIKRWQPFVHKGTWKDIKRWPSRKSDYSIFQ